MSAQLLRAPLARARPSSSARRNATCSRACAAQPRPAHAARDAAPPPPALSRRAALGAAAVSGAAALLMGAAPRAADAYATKRDDDGDFVTTDSGLRILELRPGTGDVPRKGDTVVIHWDGYTSGYQGKRIDNTSTRDEPYEFVLGGGSTIAAFDEAVSRMRPGAIVRVEVPGEAPGLSYPIDRKQRFTDEALDKDGRSFRYRLGPQPAELGGQRALDFVLDNRTLQDFNRRAVTPPSRLMWSFRGGSAPFSELFFNRTLLFDIRLLSVRRKK